MARQQFHDPIVQEQQASPIRGFQIPITGTYVLMDDVITTIHEYADTLDLGSDLVHGVAEWLRSGESLAAVDPGQHVSHVEVYPDDPVAVRPKWIARSCDSEGRILKVTEGSFDQEYVIKDAQERWPGVDVHLLTEASIDTVWEQTDPGGIRSASSGRRRPSPNRMFA